MAILFSHSIFMQWNKLGLSWINKFPLSTKYFFCSHMWLFFSLQKILMTRVALIDNEKKRNQKEICGRPLKHWNPFPFFFQFVMKSFLPFFKFIIDSKPLLIFFFKKFTKSLQADFYMQELRYCHRRSITRRGASYKEYNSPRNQKAVDWGRSIHNYASPIQFENLRKAKFEAFSFRAESKSILCRRLVTFE